MASPAKERLYKTIPKNILYSRWLVTQAVVLPDIDIVSDDDRSVSSVVNEQVQERMTGRGGLDRILSHCISPSGKVTFNVKWKNGTETQEHTRVLHEIDAMALESYQHRRVAADNGSDSSDNEVILARPINIDHDSDHSYNDDSDKNPSKKQPSNESSVHNQKSRSLATHDQSPLFRCSKCKRCSPIECLSKFPDEEQRFDDIQSLPERQAKARSICLQHQQCPQCIVFTAKPGEILAWRLSDTQQQRGTGNIRLKEAISSHKEFLVKWFDMPYRHVSWLPEDWIMATNKILYESYVKDNADDFPLICNGHPIPKQWMTIMRILDVQDKDGNKVQVGASDTIHRVFAQFCGPPNDQAYWDIPPAKDTDLYSAYTHALDEYWQRRTLSNHEEVHATKEPLASKDPNRVHKRQQQHQPAYIKGGTLMSHQLDGLNWLISRWDLRQSSVLADDKGLGKTTQVISFLSYLLIEEGAHPFLVITSNSDRVENWIREFKKWSPDMISQSYYGSQQERQQLASCLKSSDSSQLKYHALIVPIDALLSDVEIFKQIKFTVLIVDQAQLLIDQMHQGLSLDIRLQELQSIHKIVMSDTLRQYGARGLAEIMHFVDSRRFLAIRGLQGFYGSVSNDAMRTLLELFQPYYLRRTKDLLLQTLPPKSELIVPLTMTSLQRQVYQMILEDHLVKYTLADNKISSHLDNIFMLLRDMLNHLYLIPGFNVDQSTTDTQQAFIDASPKLTLFHQMLPKLLENNHRVVVLSTSASSLDILERYLSYNNNIEYLRMDDQTPTRGRMKCVDAFNDNKSTTQVFLMTTTCARYNLTRADTLILWDFDQDPCVDMRAVDCVYCAGQTKPVLVFKFMMRDTVEEKIALIAKRKLVLGKMDTPIQEKDIENILKFGVADVFEDDSESNTILYDDDAIDKLLDRSEIIETTCDNQAMRDFSTALPNISTRSSMFAQICRMNKEGSVIKEELTEENTGRDDDFWERFIHEKRKQIQEQQQSKQRAILKRKDHKIPLSEDTPAQKKPKPVIHAEQPFVSPPPPPPPPSKSTIFQPHHRPTLSIGGPLETQYPKVAVVNKRIKDINNSRMNRRKKRAPSDPEPYKRKEQVQMMELASNAADLVRRLNNRLQGLPGLIPEVKGNSNGTIRCQDNNKDEKDAAKRIHNLRTKLQQSDL